MPQHRITVPAPPARADELRVAFTKYKLTGKDADLVAYVDGRAHAEHTLAELQAYVGTTAGRIDTWDDADSTWRSEDGTALAEPEPKVVDEVVAAPGLETFVGEAALNLLVDGLL